MSSLDPCATDASTPPVEGSALSKYFPSAGCRHSPPMKFPNFREPASSQVTTSRGSSGALPHSIDTNFSVTLIFPSEIARRQPLPRKSFHSLLHKSKRLQRLHQLPFHLSLIFFCELPRPRVIHVRTRRHLLNNNLVALSRAKCAIDIAVLIVAHRRIAHPKMTKDPATDCRVLAFDIAPICRSGHATRCVAHVCIRRYKKRCAVKRRLVLELVLRISKTHRGHCRAARIIASTSLGRRPHTLRRNLRILRLALHKVRRIVKSKCAIRTRERQRCSRSRSCITSRYHDDRRKSRRRDNPGRTPLQPHRRETWHRTSQRNVAHKHSSGSTSPAKLSPFNHAKARPATSIPKSRVSTGRTTSLVSAGFDILPVHSH